MPSKTVVILGGGIGGMVAANRLRERLGTDHRVVLVERNAEHAFAPSFLWLMTGDRKPHQVRRPVADLLGRGIECVRANADGLDLSRRKVFTSAGEIPFDYLVIAVGAELVPGTVPGLAESSHDFYSFEGAARLYDALSTFSGRTIAVVVASMPYKCPGAPHEGAMLIADPQINLRQIGKAWHIGKVLFERWWLATPGWRRNAYGAMLKMGGRLYGIPITV